MYLISVSYPEEETKGVYFGCDGEYKLHVKLDMKCWNNGYRCLDLDTWINKKIKYESCFENKESKSDFPPASCPAGHIFPKVCSGDKMWNGAPNTDGREFWLGESGNQGACLVPATANTTKDVLFPSVGCASTYDLSEGWKLQKAITDCDGKWGKEVTTNRACSFRGTPFTCEDVFKTCRKSAECVIVQVNKHTKEDNFYFTEQICGGSGCKNIEVCK